MPQQEVHSCQCPGCLGPGPHPDRGLHRQINLLLSRLNEPQRRWYVGSLSAAPEQPTDSELARITGLDRKTIRRGRREVLDGCAAAPVARQRRPGGGRPRAEKTIRPS